MSLSREQLNQIRPTFPTEKVAVPEFGDGAEVTVRALSLDQSSQVSDMSAKFEAKEISLKDLLRFNAALGLVDDSGTPLYDTANEEDLAAVGAWPQDVIQRITSTLNKLSGGDGTVDDAIDAAAKNSDSSPSAA